MKASEQSAFLRYANYLPPFVGIKDYTLNAGKAKGMRMLEMRNGKGLDLTISADRCMDIAEFRFNGVNIGAHLNVGLVGPKFYQTSDDGWLRNFNGGMVQTCGLSNIGMGCVDEGATFPLHGLIGNTPAENVCATTQVRDDALYLEAVGDIHQAKVFGENLLLHRDIVCETENNALHINNRIQNLGFGKEPIQFLLHCNFGYPFINEHCKIYFSTDKVVPRDQPAIDQLKGYHLGEPPVDGIDEAAYFHMDDSPKDTRFALLHNEQLGFAVLMNIRNFPWLAQWKCRLSGTYAIGIEPGTSHVLGRDKAREDGLLKFLAPGESVEYGITLSILEQPAEIDRWKSLTKENKL